MFFVDLFGSNPASATANFIGISGPLFLYGYKVVSRVLRPVLASHPRSLAVIRLTIRQNKRRLVVECARDIHLFIC